MKAPVVPASVRIGPHSYEIRVDEETQRQLREEESNGDSRVDRLVVRIDLDRPHTAVAVTLLHELLHCVWDQTPLRLKGEGDKESEEKAVTALAPLVLDMLRENPDLVAFLTGG